MITSTPSTLRLRELSVRPRLLLTEVQLVDDVLLYQRIDGRDHVRTDVRAVRPSDADWAQLRLVLGEASFWSWPRRWPCVRDGYDGEFAIAVAWGGHAVLSTGPIGPTPEVDAVLDEVGRLVGNAPRRSSQAVATLRRAALPPPYRLDVLGGTDRVRALPGFP